MKRFFSVITVLTIVLSFASCNLKDKNENNDVTKQTQNVSFTKPVTKIYNDLADTLPDFKFSSELHETYDEGYSYSFTVKSSENDFNKYVKEAEKCGYNLNKVSGEKYFFAMNANGFKLECMYKDGNTVVSVSR